MKNIVKNVFVALAICALATVAFAGGKVRKETVRFESDVVVGGTVLKAGSYDLRFDEETGEVSVLKSGKVKAKANAYTEQRNKKADQTAIRTRDKGSIGELISVTFAGMNQDIVLGARGGAVTGN